MLKVNIYLYQGAVIATYNTLTVDLRRCVSSVLSNVAACIALMVYSRTQILSSKYSNSNCHFRWFVGLNQYILGVVTLAHLDIKITLNVDKIVT